MKQCQRLNPRTSRLQLRVRPLIHDLAADDRHQDLGLGNVMQVPRLVKVVVNMGLGEALQNAKLIESGVEQLKMITGQKPIVTRSKKAISNFKLREGVPIGVCVTMRGHRMYEFFERFVSFALPRVRDFKGLSPKAFDGRGNYTVGVKEQLIFPEINYDKVDHIKGMNITICTSARTDEEGKCLLKHLGLPLRK
ncbi:MAG: 50S ribosomal protein L5 [Nitrospinae bacterium]|nr:50S ribosomal protein L5 [Nitrospinota bacterium]